MTYRSDKNKPVLKSHTGPLPIYRLVTMYYVLLCPVSYQWQDLCPRHILFSIMKTRLLNILKILQPKKAKFYITKSDIFHISAQNIDCGYSLEPPRRGGSNDYHNVFEQK